MIPYIALGFLLGVALSMIAHRVAFGKKYSKEEVIQLMEEKTKDKKVFRTSQFINFLKELK